MAAKKRFTPLKGLVLGLCVFGVDVFVLNAGVFSLVAGAGAVVKLARALGARSLVARLDPDGPARLAGLGIVLCAAILSLGLTLLNLRAATVNAARVIAAVEDYRVQHDRYPESLATLVPGRLDGIPRAAFLASPPYAGFRYEGTPENASLSYVPGFFVLRRQYDFQDRQWRVWAE